MPRGTRLKGVPPTTNARPKMMKKSTKQWFKLREIEIRVLISIFHYVKRGRFFYYMLAITKGITIALLSLVPLRVHDRCSVTLYLKKLQNYLMKLNKLALINVDGTIFVVHDYEALNIVLPLFENKVSKFIDYAARKHGRGVFLDVGAHVGKYSIKMANYGWSVVALEPHPLNYILLSFNAKINGCDIKSLKLAAYSFKGVLNLYLGDFSGRHSVARKSDSYVPVQAETVDDLMCELNVPLNSVKLVKIDVEGAAIEVLKGMMNLIKVARPDIIIEVWPKEREALNILRSLGFKIVPICDEVTGAPLDIYYAYHRGL